MAVAAERLAAYRVLRCIGQRSGKNVRYEGRGRNGPNKQLAGGGSAASGGGTRACEPYRAFPRCTKQSKCLSEPATMGVNQGTTEQARTPNIDNPPRAPPCVVPPQRRPPSVPLALCPRRNRRSPKDQQRSHWGRNRFPSCNAPPARRRTFLSSSSKAASLSAACSSALSSGAAPAPPSAAVPPASPAAPAASQASASPRPPAAPAETKF